MPNVWYHQGPVKVLPDGSSLVAPVLAEAAHGWVRLASQLHQSFPTLAQHLLTRELLHPLDWILEGTCFAEMDQLPSMIRVLVVNAKPGEQSTLRHAFPGNGYHLTMAQSGREALRHIEHFPVDVIVLDSATVEPDGWRTRRLIRARSSVPIIMLINPAEELGRRRDLGPDEFVVKPVRADDVAMRAESQLRRRKRQAEEQARQGIRTFDGGRLAFDLDRREVQGAQGRKAVTVMEYKLLLYLSETPGIVRSPDQIVREVWGSDFPGQKDNVKVHIANLRRKLDSCVPGRVYIEGRRGHGYMFVAEPSAADPPA